MARKKSGNNGERISSIYLGYRIRTVREQRGFSAQCLADKVCVTKNHIALIEGGEKMPSTKLLLRIIEALDCCPDELLFDYLEKQGNTWLEDNLARLLDNITPERRYIILKLLEEYVDYIADNEPSTNVKTFNTAPLYQINTRINKKTFAHEFGTNTANIRKDKGISVASLANTVGVGKKYIMQIENGERVPSVDIILCIANALGTTIGELFGSFAGQPRELRKNALAAKIAALPKEEYAKTEANIRLIIKSNKYPYFVY